MKQKFLLTLSMLLLATSCNNNNDNLTILTPTGAPSLAFYNYYNDDNYQTNSTPINIVSQMTENGDDIIVIDTIKGIQTINEGAPYKLACNITFGNFYIASTGNDDNNIMDKDDEIVIFGKNQTPDKIFNLLYGSDYNITYVPAVSDASKCLISGKTLDLKKDVDYVFIAQPVLTNALNNNKKASIYQNIQELYTQKTQKELIQAGLFVKNGTSKRQINKFLDNLENDITVLLENPSILNEKTKDIDETLLTNKIGIKTALAIKTIENNNSIGLGFKMASDNKDNINEFIALFNLTIDNESIYQK